MITLFSTLLVILIVAGGFVAIFSKKLLSSVISMGLVSLGVSGLFFFLQAPDVAITEAAIGAGLSTAIFIIAMKKIQKGGTSDDE